MPDESSATGAAGVDGPGDESLTWVAAAAVVQKGTGGVEEAAADVDEPDQPDESTGSDDSPELDLAGQELAELGGAPAATPDDEDLLGPSSDRAAELVTDHWRERAIVWRERAMGAELVAKMLQRNLDDLRANLEDLRLKVEAADEQRAAIASSASPWRRFARDMYDKYLR
jgi:hypothetical protein